MYAPTEDKCCDKNNSYCEEAELVYDQFHMYHMKMLLQYFSVKVGREDIFKSTIGNKSLHETSNDNGIRVF
jgi:hypothetical protein